MTTVLIIICILFCIGIVIAIVGHLGHGIAADAQWRSRLRRTDAARGRRDRTATRRS